MILKQSSSSRDKLVQGSTDYLPEWDTLDNNQKNLAEDIIQNPDKYMHCKEGVRTCKGCTCADCAKFEQLDKKFKGIEANANRPEEVEQLSVARKVETAVTAVVASSITIQSLFIAKDPVGFLGEHLTLWLSTDTEYLTVGQYAIAIEISTFLIYAFVRSLSDPVLQAMLTTAISGVAYTRLTTIFLDISEVAWVMTEEKAKEKIPDILAHIHANLLKPGIKSAAAVAAGSTQTIGKLRSAVARVTNKAATSVKSILTRANEAKNKFTERFHDMFPRTSCDFQRGIKAGKVSMKGLLSKAWSMIQKPIKQTIKDAKKADELEHNPRLKWLTEQWLIICIDIVKALLFEPASAMVMGFLYLEFTLGRLALKLIMRGGKSLKKLLKPIVAKLWRVV